MKFTENEDLAHCADFVFLFPTNFQKKKWVARKETETIHCIRYLFCYNTEDF